MKIMTLSVTKKIAAGARRWMIGSVVLLGTLLLAAPANAQQDLASLDASGLLKEATRALEVGRYEMAIPYLQGYLDRMTYVEDERVLAMMQEVRLKLAKIYAHSENYPEAVEKLNEYTDMLPLYRPREAYKLLAVNLFKMQKFEECIEAATTALSRPLPVDLERKEIETNYDEMDRSETAGLTARQLRRLDEDEKKLAEKKDLAAGFSGKKTEAEADYTVDELVALYWVLAESYKNQEKWEECLEAYQYVIDNSTKEDIKGSAIMQTVTALVNLARFDEAGTYVQQLYQTDAKYNIRVNMALMKVAYALFGEEQYDNALMLFRMILPREVLVEYQERRMNEVRREAGLPDVQITITTNNVGELHTVFGNKVSRLTAQINEQGEMVKFPPKPAELEDMEMAVKQLVSLQPYENDVLYAIGMLYSKAGRPWEAILVFDEVMVREPYTDRADEVFAEKLSLLADPLLEYDLVEKLATEYLMTHDDGLGPRRVAHSLTICYQRQKRWADITKLRPTLDKFIQSEDVAILRYDCELYFLQAIADLMTMKFDDAKEHFEYVIDRFPDFNMEEMQQRENSAYWIAMCDLYLQEYKLALEEFAGYAEQYPEGNWIPSVRFHQGVSYFGEMEYTNALREFAFVMDNYPEEDIYPDACSMHGDLVASGEGTENGEADLDIAEGNYRMAIDVAGQRYAKVADDDSAAAEAEKNTAVRQATYAVFQMAAMFDLNATLKNGLYDKVLDAVYEYKDTYGSDADVAKAAFWIGKTKLAQGQIDEAIDAYKETILTYGDDVTQAGVDDIIAELSQVATRKLNPEQQLALKNDLQDAIETVENVTLELRLRVLLAQLNGTQLKLGRQLIEEVEDLSLAPPPVLALICDASFEDKDYSRAAEIMEIFQLKYEQSDFTGPAMKLRCYDLFEKGEYLEALQIIDQVQAMFGTDIQAAWAEIMQGRIQMEALFADSSFGEGETNDVSQLQQAAFNTAKTTFEDMLKVQDWRGEPYAEATYYLGQLYENMMKTVDRDTDFDTWNSYAANAFAWYQRTYMQYKGYAQGYWAAEAYLASARICHEQGRFVDRDNTYRAMLYDRYVNKLPQADQAREKLGAEAREIDMNVAQGVASNIVVSVDKITLDKSDTNEVSTVTVEETQE